MPSPGSTDAMVEFLKTDNGQRLAIVAYSLISTLVLVTLSGSYAAVVIGFPYLFFIPGFAVVRLFFWKGTSQEAKFVLSIGLSILVIIFLGLGLALTPIGLSSNTARASLILFSLAAVAIDVLWKRPEMIIAKEKERKKAELEPKTIKLDKVVAAMLGTAIVVSVISLGLIITAEYPSRTYFAMTDLTGNANINLTRDINTTFSVMLEMKNGEESTSTFKVVVYNLTWDVNQTFNKTLQKGETWDQVVDIYLDHYGSVRFDFDLYITEGNSPEYFYGNLHVWLEVL